MFKTERIMPINITGVSEDFVLGEYISPAGKQYRLRVAVEKAVADEKEAMLVLINFCTKRGYITPAQSMAYRRHVISPNPNEYYKEIRKKRDDKKKSKSAGLP